jgi:hypothetical protein
METRRWTNPSQPQTLYIATFLLYATAVIAVLLGGLGTLVNPISLAVIGGEVASAFGIANERKWGYYLAVGMASVGLVLHALPLIGHIGLIFNPMFLLDILFPVALFALLVHPVSREYQKIWFH